MLLSIDTSTRNASVALHDGTRVIASRSWRSTVNHSTELMPAVVEILRGNGIGAGSLSAVAVALGPGGFSALRTGLSVAKGLAISARIPIVGVGSLDLEAHPFLDAGLTVCALIEAGRGEAASALISPGPRPLRLREDRITGPDALVEEFLAGDAKTTLFCGEGLAAWSNVLKDSLKDEAVICRVPPSVRAESLAEIAAQKLSDGEVDDLDSLQPNYLRMPSIGVPKRRDRRPQDSSRHSLSAVQGI